MFEDLDTGEPRGLPAIRTVYSIENTAKETAGKEGGRGRCNRRLES